MADKKVMEIFDQPNNLIEEFKERSKHIDRTSEKGIVNDVTGSSITIRNNGDTVIAASETAQYKLNHDSGTSTEITYQSNTITNRKNIMTDEIVINSHKLNPQLYELGDMKQLHNDSQRAIGNLTMLGTVLVKSWEPNLGKYVLIRRQIRIPMFSPTLNIPDAPQFYGIDTDVSKEINQLNKE